MGNIFETNKGFNAPQFVSTSFKDAKKHVRDGLRYFIGENAKWMNEYESVCDWLEDNKGRGLLIYGENGLGKSMLCYNIIPIMFEELRREVRIFKCRAGNLGMIYRNSDKSVDYSRMMAAQVLFIDDIGTESIASNYGEKIDVFSDIIDVAEQDKKLLVITTNLIPKEIEARYGLRTIDRLHALTRAVCFQGESLRGKIRL